MCFVVRLRWRPLKSRFSVHKSWFSSFLSAHMYCGNFWRLKQHGWSCYWCTFTSWQRSGEVNYVLHFFSRDIGIKIIPLLFVKKTLSNTLCILMFVWFSRFTRIVRSPCTCLECECDLQLWSTVGSQSQLNTYPVDHGLELILITVWNVYWKNNNVLEVEIN